MAEIPDVIPGADIDSSWGNTIRSRTIMRYTDQAALTASIPFPVAGDLAFLNDTNTVWYWNNVAWTRLLEFDGDSNVFDGAGVTRLSFPAAGRTGLFDPNGDLFFEWDESSTLIRGYIQAAEAFRFRGAQGLQLGDALFGTAAFPGISWISDADTGIYRSASNQVSVASGGVQRARFDSGGLSIIDGSIGNPAYGFLTDSDTGMYLAGSNNLQFVAAGAQVLGMSTSTFTAPKVYTATTGSAANVWVNTDGAMRRSTSARKYKTDIKALPKALVKKTLEPVTFKHEDGGRYAGFIADDVAALDKRLGIYEDGEIENYDLRGVVALLAAQVNELRAEVKALSGG